MDKRRHTLPPAYYVKNRSVLFAQASDTSILEFDTSDTDAKSLPDFNNSDGGGGDACNSRAVATAINLSVHGSAATAHNHQAASLMFVGLLEEWLNLITGGNTEKSKQYFKMICFSLYKLNYLPRIAELEEFSSVRTQYKSAFMTVFNHIKRITADQVGVHMPNSDLVIDNLRSSILKDFSSIHSHTLLSINSALLDQTSRYCTDFDEMEMLGSGAFGSVYKVRHKFDSNMYAVKKILFSHSGIEQCLKLLREVKLLAQLDHPNVITYKSAWLEVCNSLEQWNKQQQHCGAAAASRTEDVSSEMAGQVAADDVNYSSGIIFADTRVTVEELKQTADANQAIRNRKSSLSDGHVSHRVQNGRNCAPGVPSLSAGADYSKRQPVAVRGNTMDSQIIPYRKFIHKEMYCIYIQMQLCHRTLKEMIAERNLHASSLTDPFHAVEEIAVMDIFKQIMEGVRYIHSKAIIHRDLKPQNIFLVGPAAYRVMIGDFGLACREAHVDARTRDVCAAFEQHAHVGEGLCVVNETTSTTIIGGGEHTSGIGTVAYAAPEQLNSTHYTNKVDIFSAGVILFELLHPFGTVMEKQKVISAVRLGQLPVEFAVRYPPQAELIKAMVDADCVRRADVRTVLANDMFASSQWIIDTLKAQLAKKDEEIAQLRMQLLESKKD